MSLLGQTSVTCKKEGLILLLVISSLMPAWLYIFCFSGKKNLLKFRICCIINISYSCSTNGPWSSCNWYHYNSNLSPDCMTNNKRKRKNPLNLQLPSDLRSAHSSLFSCPPFSCFGPPSPPLAPFSVAAGGLCSKSRLPAQHQAAGPHSWQLNAEHSGAFSSSDVALDPQRC